MLLGLVREIKKYIKKNVFKATTYAFANSFALSSKRISYS